MAGLQSASLKQRELAFGVAKEGPPSTEKGSVEVGVDTAEGQVAGYRSRMALGWRLTDRTLDLGRPIGAGIVNVTDDSMFEGARSGTPERAIEDGLRLAEAGFDMLDIGAVVARSGPPVPPDQEAGRLVPAIRGLTERTELPISADTFSSEVARAALEAGAVAINDIAGGADEMLDVAAETGCGLVLMHIEGPPRVTRPIPSYDDPVDHLRRWFTDRLEAAAGRGVSEDQIALDPGLDFDLSAADDLEILRRLGELRELGRPLYVSLSRKDFLGAVLAGSWEERLPATEREWATASAVALAVRGGADIVRLHDASALQSVAVAGAIRG
jgi:dihydropteroate synthase